MFDGQPKRVEVYDREGFEKWRESLPYTTQRLLNKRLVRLEAGNPGKPEIGWKSLGDGVYELKIDDGVGYRVYFTFSGTHIILLLFGGTKPKQNADIAAAKKLWAEIQSTQD